MDKRIIFASAGSGKTTYIVDSLSSEERVLILTYTIGNYENIKKKIIDKFAGNWPENICLMTYFSFLFTFCFKPLLAYRIRAKGIIYEVNQNRFANQNQLKYYMNDTGFLYSNRLSLLFEKQEVVNDIKDRLTRYFDRFVIDEVQDIGGRDFNFLLLLINTDIDMLFVGDFYQHTFDTSLDGNTNNSLYVDKVEYETNFSSLGVTIDESTLCNSWRCSISVCDFISRNLGISIFSNRQESDDTKVEYISDTDRISQILNDKSIIKLHYQKSSIAGNFHKNWGDTKGEDHYRDVCILLNKKSAEYFRNGQLSCLPPRTRNKLYVAITRARGNVYLIDE